jgi:hypothetical protein
LARQRILTIEKDNGSKVVSAFSPLFQSAFEKMVTQCPQLCKSLDILAKKADIAKDMEELNKIEDELIKLRDAESKRLAQGEKDETDALRRRRNLLHQKMVDWNAKLEKKEMELKQIESRVV